MYEDDCKILKAFLNSDDKVMETFYDQHRSSFIAFILKYFPLDETDITDIYQDSFTALYLNIIDKKLVCPLDSTLKTYLLSIGRNKTLNFIRYRNKAAITTHEFPEIPVVPSIDILLKENEDKQFVKQLLELIGEPCKTLLHLFYIKQMKYKDISEILKGQTSEALRKMKFDCLKRLKKLIQ